LAARDSFLALWRDLACRRRLKCLRWPRLRLNAGRGGRLIGCRRVCRNGQFDLLGLDLRNK